MAHINRVTMIGNLTKDPEVRKTSAGASVCTFGIASNRLFKNKQTGAMDKETCFIDINVWGPYAEICKQLLKSGQQVLVDGYIKFNSWQDNSGNKRYKHLVNAERIVPIYHPDQVANFNGPLASSSVPVSAPSNNPSNMPETGNGMQNSDADEDMPF